MKKRLLATILAAAMAAMALAGCSSSNSSSSTPEASPAEDSTSAAEDAAEETPSEESPAEEATPASGDAEYAVILKTQAVDFWVKMKNGVEEEAKKLGVTVDVYAAQSEEDTEGQLKIMESCLDKGYKAIGVAPLSPVNVIPAVVQANEKGIYVMNIDEKLDMDTLRGAGGYVIGFATTDNVAVGAKGAQAIIDAKPDGGKVAIIEGKAGNKSGEDRKNGATEAFAGNDKFELVGSQPADWDRQKALDIATTFIQNNPDLVGIYCCNDGMALGVVQAVINADKLGEIAVVGTDGDTEAVDSVNNSELTATVAQDPAEIGATSLRMMVEAVNNQAEVDPEAEPALTPIDSFLITKED